MVTLKTKELLPVMTRLFELLPVEKKFYLLGYAQSEVDKIDGDKNSEQTN